MQRFIVAGLLAIMLPAIVQGKSHTIGVSPHEHTKKFKLLLERSYASLDVEIKFIEYPVSGCSLQELASGNLDGEVLRSRHSSQKHDNIILVEPALVEVSVYLVCAPDVECSTTVFDDHSAKILATSAQFELLPERYKANQYLSFVEVRNVTSVYSMFAHQRHQYAIFSVDDAQPLPLEGNYQTVLLHKLNGYHVLHSRHRELLEPLQKAIQQQLAIAQ